MGKGKTTKGKFRKEGQWEQRYYKLKILLVLLSICTALFTLLLILNLRTDYLDPIMDAINDFGNETITSIGGLI